MAQTTVRARFTCEAVRKMRHWSKPGEFLYEAEFHAVTGTGRDPEDEKFFEATPSGTLKLATLKADHFTPGKTYQVDFSEIAE